MSRRINVDAVPGGLLDKNPPPTDSLSWGLWLRSQDLAQEALRTDYIQGIGNGNLDPNAYGIYTVHDAAYCYQAENDYGTAETRARNEGQPELAELARLEREGYGVYRQQVFASWGVLDGAALDPGQAMRDYIDIERTIATQAPPIYLIVAMIPCDQLWAWLAEQLAAKSTPTNLYSFWITENAPWSGAYVLDNFVDFWNAEHPGALDDATALAVYRACMTCEVNAFRAATGQPLLPVPPLLF